MDMYYRCSLLLAKMHLPHVHAQGEQDFLHELQFYEDIHIK
jgi:hypothetical protein